MKHRLLVVAATLAIISMAVGCTAEEKKSAKIELKDMKDKVSYAIGLSIGKDFQKQELEIDAEVLARGVRDGFTGVEPLMTEEQIRETQQEFQKEVVAKQQERAKRQAEENLEEGQAFLAENAKKEGVVTTESGLQYQIIEEGSGQTPSIGDKVTVHYVGTLVDGTEFDSSYTRGEPATFPVGGVIPGWTEALQLMKEGAKWKLFIPADLAYGERGAGPVIGPNATLLFEVELIKIGEPAPEAAPEKSDKE